MQLPPDLQLALEKAAQGLSPADLRAQAGSLSERYRADHSRPGARFAQGAKDAAAYVVTRMPATWGAVAAALDAAAEVVPEWEPRSLLDCGAGTGAAAWAATAVWPSLQALTLLERERAMAALGRELASQSRSAPLRAATWREHDLTVNDALQQADLVTLAYVLGEVPAAAHAIIERLWAATTGLLVLIEPGTPRGFALIRAAREQLIGLGAQIVAPCPHAAACPMAGDDWCHFAERIPRLRSHRAAKGAALGYEDEKYSYVAVARFPAAPAAARVLRHPRVEPARISLELCASDGLRSVTIGKRDPAWRAARKVRWGDAFGE